MMKTVLWKESCSVLSPYFAVIITQSLINRAAIANWNSRIRRDEYIAREARYSAVVSLASKHADAFDHA